MTRDQVKEQFPDATEEQVTAILNINGTDLAEAKKKNVDPKELKRLQDIEIEYGKLQDAGLTDAEKAAKALADAETAKVDFAKKSNRLDAEKILVAAGLTEAEYEKLMDSIVTDDAEVTKTNATNLATLIKGQKDAAIQKTKEELMDGTLTLGGGSGASGGDEGKTDAEKFAESMVEEKASDAKGAEDIIGAYK